MRCSARMKTTTIPSIRVESDFRAEVEAVMAVHHQLEDDYH